MCLTPASHPFVVSGLGRHCCLLLLCFNRHYYSFFKTCITLYFLLPYQNPIFLLSHPFLTEHWTFHFIFNYTRMNLCLKFSQNQKTYWAYTINKTICSCRNKYFEYIVISYIYFLHSNFVNFKLASFMLILGSDITINELFIY